MPRARRMSSLCTSVSPSQVWLGPGGCFTDVATDSKLASVSAGEAPRFAATPFSWTLSKLNPEPISLATNPAGGILAVEVMWASTSRTVHSLHSEGAAQSSALRSCRSAARARRSVCTTGQMSMSPPLGQPLRRVCPYYSVVAKLVKSRTSRKRRVPQVRRGTAEGDVRDIQKVLAALTSPVRREILDLIWDRELSAGEIAAAFPVTKPTISQHLAVLREAGLAESTAVGTSRRYRARRDALRGLRAALGSAGRWTNADQDPASAGRAPADVRTTPVVLASADVDTSQEATFAAFTDPVIYSRWLGVPVTLQDGRFACTMEWGTSVRGRYELVCPPELIVMRWDFEDDNVPVPGGEMTGYLRIRCHPPGAHVEVHQIVDTTEQAEFMERAWAMVLGRLQAGVVQASDPDSPMPMRLGRPKQRGVVPPERALGPHQPRPRHSPRCGRSVPSVVSLPCPGYTQVASGSGPNRRSVTSVSSEVKSPVELVLPTPPGNSESTVNTCGVSDRRPPASYSTARLPGVCPRR